MRLGLKTSAAAPVAAFLMCALAAMPSPDAGLATLSEPLTMAPLGIALAPGESLPVNTIANDLNALDGIGMLDALEKQ